MSFHCSSSRRFPAVFACAWRSVHLIVFFGYFSYDIFDMIQQYADALHGLVQNAVATTSAGVSRALPLAFEDWFSLMSDVRARNKKVLFIGNGGSAAIANHKALDYTNAGDVRSISFTDPSLLTCFGNDFSYENIFQKSVSYYADAGDMLVAISSYGSSQNILRGVAEARKKQCGVITFSGFAKANPLRAMGDLNFYAPSENYTLVENAHEILLDAFLACWLHPRFKGEAASP